MEAVSTARSHEEALRLEETKRRKREGVVILVATLMVLAFAYFEVQAPEVSPEYSLSGNIAFFLLININIILLVLLVFLVSRNLVKLLFERKPGILGSRSKSSFTRFLETRKTSRTSSMMLMLMSRKNAMLPLSEYSGETSGACTSK